MKDDSFVTFILDQLEELGDVRSNKMFGGWGLYCGEDFFGIVSDDHLYFKTDETTRQRYIDLDMKPFAPSKKQVLKNYYEVPPDVMEDREQLVTFAEESCEVARK